MVKECLPPKIVNKKGCLLLPLLCNISLKILEKYFIYLFIKINSLIYQKIYQKILNVHKI